jgi:hypothetical protein
VTCDCFVMCFRIIIRSSLGLDWYALVIAVQCLYANLALVHTIHNMLQ